MRKSFAAVATAGVLSLGVFAPSALAQSSAPSGDTRAQSASQAADVDAQRTNCDKKFEKAKTGYVYSYKHANCKTYVGKDKNDSYNWNGKADNKASSLINKGVGRYSQVKFYQKPGNSSTPGRGGTACLKQSELYADNLIDNKLSNGRKANDTISAHKWIKNSTQCSAYLT